jgi:glutamate synthase domain-containing protein 2
LKSQGLRERIKILASGKLITAFDILRAIEAGADGIYMARGFMFALGCVQSLKCNKDTCPVGLTTMDPRRRQALVPSNKAVRVANFHRNTLRGVNQMLSACGLEDIKDFSSECYQTRLES